MDWLTPARAAIVDRHLARGGLHMPLQGNGRALGMGYIPDRAAVRLTQAPMSPLTSTPSANAELIPFRPPIFDQGGSGSCTGHGTATALFTSYAAAGRPLPFVPSPRIMYALPRVLELLGPNLPLNDTGAMPSDLTIVVPKWGIVPIGFRSQCPTPDGRYSDVWTSEDVMGGQSANVNDKPTLLDLEQAGLTLSPVPLRIDETRADFGAQIRNAIDRKIACGVGLFVDMGFQNWNGKAPISQINLSDPTGGGHWLAMDYYYTTPGGVLVVGGPNSWSVNWPNATGSSPSEYWRPGCWEMTIDCLQSACSDCLAFSIGA